MTSPLRAEIFETTPWPPGYVPTEREYVDWAKFGAFHTLEGDFVVCECCHGALHLWAGKWRHSGPPCGTIKPRNVTMERRQAKWFGGSLFDRFKPMYCAHCHGQIVRHGWRHDGSMSYRHKPPACGKTPIPA